MGLDMQTLVRLNLYLIVPAVVYFGLVSSDLRRSDVAIVIGFHVLLIFLLLWLTLVVAVLRGVPRDQRRAMIMSVIHYNSGNYGLPLQDLAFRDVGLSNAAVSLQVFVLVVQNFTTFTLGVFLAAGANGADWKRSARAVLRFPSLYAIVLAVITIQIRAWLGDHADDVARGLAPFWEVLRHLRNAFVALALVTLGAQLAVVRQETLVTRYPVPWSVGLRLLGAPALAAAMVWLFGLKGLVAEALLVSSATPTAVNSMLLCREFANHPQYLARAVFYSTLISPVTVTAVIYVSRSGWLGG
jgi:hypothetical protein